MGTIALQVQSLQPRTYVNLVSDVLQIQDLQLLAADLLSIRMMWVKVFVMNALLDINVQILQELNASPNLLPSHSIVMELSKFLKYALLVLSTMWMVQSHYLIVLGAHLATTVQIQLT